MQSTTKYINIPSREDVAEIMSRPISPRQSYTFLNPIGHGTFGKVFSALNKSGRRVAIKCVPQNPDFKNRELNILKDLHSPFTLQLLDFFVTKPNDSELSILNIVTDIFPQSLSSYLEEIHQFSYSFDPLLRKLWIYQLFCGIDYIHSIGITHRDLKPGNLLVNSYTGQLKLCDFGSAKVLTERNQKCIGSRYYRAPELLLGCSSYTNKIDIWSAGCIIAEMFLDDMAMFQGNDDLDQLDQIIHILGKPTDDDLSSFDHEVQCLSNENQICNLETALPYKIDHDVLSLLKEIFVYNPSKRPTARECMKSPYFNELFEPNVKLSNGNDLPSIPKPY